MSHTTRSLIARASLWIFYGLLAYMPVHIFLSTWLGTSFGLLEVARIAKDIILVIGVVLAAAAGIRRVSWGHIAREPLVWLIGAYAAYTLLMALYRPTDTDAEILGVVYNLRFLLFFLYALVLRELFDVRHVVKRSVQIVLTAGAVVVMFGVLQYWILPDSALSHVGYARPNGVLPAFFIDDKPDLERIMSTLRDPNSLASYLIIIGPLAAAAILLARSRRNKYLASGLLVFTLLAVWYTFSRSGWIGFAVAMALFVFVSDKKFKTILLARKKMLLAISGSLLVIILGSLFVLRDSYFVQNVILHADESTVLEDPNELRVRFFKESVQKIGEDPVGSGPGTAGLASIRNNVQGTKLNENYYLQIGSEVGVIGLLLFLAILGVVGWHLWRLAPGNPVIAALFASFVGLALTNFLVHIWSNEAVAYTWWGLAGLVLVTTKRKQRT